jgi:hypothetical protein
MCTRNRRQKKRQQHSLNRYTMTNVWKKQKIKCSILWIKKGDEPQKYALFSLGLLKNWHKCLYGMKSEILFWKLISKFYSIFANILVSIMWDYSALFYWCKFITTEFYHISIIASTSLSRVFLWLCLMRPLEHLHYQQQLSLVKLWLSDVNRILNSENWKTRKPYNILLSNNCCKTNLHESLLQNSWRNLEEFLVPQWGSWSDVLS